MEHHRQYQSGDYSAATSKIESEHHSKIAEQQWHEYMSSAEFHKARKGRLKGGLSAEMRIVFILPRLPKASAGEP